MEFNSSYDQTNFMGYYPPSPIPNDDWKYHQQIIDLEHSNPWRYASEPQDEQEHHMGYFPPTQNDSSHYSNGNFNDSYSTYQRLSSLKQTFNSFMESCQTSPSSFSSENSSSLYFVSTQNSCQNSQTTPTSWNQGLSQLESMFERYEEETKKAWTV
ncbi:hypothetical protein AHAS_Ahas03G0219200 [Arachis hypogaea]